MSVNIFQPHHPFWPTKDYLDRYDPDKLPSPAYQKGLKESYRERENTRGSGQTHA
jgi:hypothetical protein